MENEKGPTAPLKKRVISARVSAECYEALERISKVNGLARTEIIETFVNYGIKKFLEWEKKQQLKTPEQ